MTRICKREEEEEVREDEIPFEFVLALNIIRRRLLVVLCVCVIDQLEIFEWICCPLFRATSLDIGGSGEGHKKQLGMEL